MSAWAVIKVGGKQYKVTEGETLVVDRLLSNGKSGILEFKDVLLLFSDQGLVVGKPKVEKVSVVAKVVEDFKDKKVRVVKFKSKSRYLNVRGHRQQKTKVLIEKIRA